MGRIPYLTSAKALAMKRPSRVRLAYILVGLVVLVVGCVVVERKASKKQRSNVEQIETTVSSGPDIFQNNTTAAASPPDDANDSDVATDPMDNTEFPTFLPVATPTETPVHSETTDVAVADAVTATPSRSPVSKVTATRAPTLRPTKPPLATRRPTSRAPTAEPTKRPTRNPTEEPTDQPTEEPTSSPVDPRIRNHRPPENPRRGYFNYDPQRSSPYGPNKWPRVDGSQSFVREFGADGFGIWRDSLVDATRNKCDRYDKQSPIDLVTTEEGCEEHHMIRPRLGAYAIGNDAIAKQIQGNKLRLDMNRRNCLDLEDPYCKSDGPPMVDFPKYGGGGNSDMIHLDIKYPGEHYMEGEAYDAEIQMMHMHHLEERVASIGVLIRASSDGYNAKFQEILDEFQAVYDADAAACEDSRRQRRLRASRTRRTLENAVTGTTNQTTVVDHDIWGDYSTYLDDPNQTLERKLQSRSRFDPYDRSIMRTIYFYRYEGSITEPPCSLVTWFIMTKAMEISFKQLKQIKTLILKHVDSECEKTSLHYDESVARPLQPVGERPVTKCSRSDFLHDDEK